MIAAVLVQGAAMWGMRGLVFDRTGDFSRLYESGKLILSGHGHDSYSAEGATLRSEPASGPAHPPFELLLFGLLSVLPYKAAFIFWYGVNCLLTGVFLHSVASHYPKLARESPLLVLFVGVAFTPLMVALVQGQDSVLLLLAVAASYFLLLRGKPMAAGSVLALCVFKPQFALPTALLIGLRRPKLLVGFASTCAGLVALTVALVGWQGLIEYCSSVFHVNRLAPAVSGVKPVLMPNVRGMISSLLRQESTPVVLAISSVLLAVGISAPHRNTTEDERYLALTFSLAVVVSLLVSYHAYIHDFVLLLLPILLTANYLAGDGPKIYPAGLRLALACTCLFSSLFLPVFFPAALVGSMLLLTLSLRLELGQSSVPLRARGSAR